MIDYCECDIFAKNFTDIITFFLKNYNQFLKIDGKKIKDKKSFNDMKNKYDSLISICKNMTPKGNECITVMTNCPKDHKKQKEEITLKVNKSEELIEKIERHYSKIKSQIPPIEDDKEDEKEEENKININNINLNNKTYEDITD